LTLALGKAAVTVAHAVMAIFLPRVDSALGKAFAKCPTKSTRQRALLNPVVIEHIISYLN
jgi:hypothetical protein